MNEFAARTGPGWQRQLTNEVDCWLARPAPGVTIAFVGRHRGTSTGSFASLNCSYEVGDQPDHVNRNRTLICNALGLSSLVTVRQVHSATVVAAESLPANPESVAADAIVTARPGCLGIKVADCLPVWLFTTNGRAVAIAHCGWRGSAARLAARTAQTLASTAGCRTDELAFSLGPSICRNCYVVGADVRSAMIDLPEARLALTPGPVAGKYQLDLRTLNRLQLVSLGLSEFPGLELCSMENPDSCFSVRREKLTGRNLVLIAFQTGGPA